LSPTASTQHSSRPSRSPAIAVSTSQAAPQALTAGVVDELTLDIAPVFLGEGERLFDGVAGLELAPVETLHSPHATHVRYRVER
jgi:dihydrofolate reductase